jgi:hypothetical protein
MITLIDKQIDLNAACEKANWHNATAIESLISQGIDREDAAAFVAYAFNEKAIKDGGIPDTNDSSDLLTADQDDRISVK